MIVDRFGRDYGSSRAAGKPDLSFLNLGADVAIQKLVKEHSGILGDLRTFAEASVNWIDVGEIPKEDDSDFDRYMDDYTRLVRYRTGSIVFMFAVERHADNRLGVRRVFQLINFGMPIAKRAALKFANLFFEPKQKMTYHHDKASDIWVFTSEYERPKIEVL